MSSNKRSPSIFRTLQKTADNAAAVNSEFIRQFRVNDLEENPMNRFSMAEDAEFQATMNSLKQDGFLEDIIVTPAETPGKYRIVSGHRRVRAARKLGKATVPCKVRRYQDPLEELRALMGSNLHRRCVSPFDMARQLETLREVLRQQGKLPETVKAQMELMAAQTGLSRATVERYLDLLNLDETIADWAESGKMTMTDAYELARRSNIPLYPAVKAFVEQAEDRSDLPTLIHRAIAYARAAAVPQTPPKPIGSSALRSVDSFNRSLRRSTDQMRSLTLAGDTDKAAVREKLDACLAQLEELQRTVEELKETLD